MKEKFVGVIVATLILAATPFAWSAPSFVARSAEASTRLPVSARAPRATSYAPQRRQAAFVPAASRSAAPVKIIGQNGYESLGVKTTANKVYVADLASGAELYSQNPDAPSPIASITKLMTALVVLDNKPDWKAKVTMVDPTDGGGMPYFAPGDVVTVRDLWQAMFVGSSNAATEALAASTGLSADAFAAAMNAKAARLGLSHSHFVEPTGLDAGDVSTARDVSLLLKTAIQNKDIASAMLVASFDLKKIAGKTVHVAATDKLLSSFINKKPYKILGAKTGFIDESGHNIAVTVSKESAGTVIVVVIGSATDDARFQEAKSLAYWAYQNYSWPSRLAAATE